MKSTLSRPAVVVRVGITGHRKLGTEAVLLEPLSNRLGIVLAAIQREVKAIHDLDKQEKCGPLYDPDKTPILRLVSGLAAGADQFAADAALTAGWQLEAVLPFAVDDFCKDFKGQDGHATTFGAKSGMSYPDDLVAFNELYRRAGDSHIELCGQRDSTCLRNLAYLSVGQMIVRRCEILIAVWNGKCSEGVGGTADVIEFALRSGTRVLWIDPGKPTDWYWLSELAEFFAILAGQRGGLRNNEAGLIKGELHRLLRGRSSDDGLGHREPEDAAGHTDEAVGPFCRWLAKPIGERHLTLEDMYKESLDLVAQPPLPARLFTWVRDLWSRPKPEDRDVDVPDGVGIESPESMEPESHFNHAYNMVDGCATLYSHKYRSAYVAIFALGAVALSVAVVAVAGWKWSGTIVEFLALIGITFVFLVERKYAWHRRWISYRLLAELLRHARYLAIIGRSLPASGSAASNHASTPEENWVLAFLHAHSRAAPATGLVLSYDRLSKVRDRVFHDLVEDQLRYHTKNRIRCYRIAVRLGALANILFFTTMLLVMIKLFGLVSCFDKSVLSGLGVAAGILPAMGAAIFAFRQQSEFEVLEQRSELMLKALDRAGHRLGNLGDCTQPMAADLLGQEIYALADLMISDIAEWSVVFKVKVVETA